MASKASPPKPWEVRKSSPAISSVPVSSAVARSAQEPTDIGSTGIPIDRMDPSSRSPHIGGGNSTITPRVPPRPGIGSSIGSTYNSPYNSLSSSYGGYGGGYGSNLGGSSYGSGYGSSLGGSSYGSGYGSSLGGSSYGSGYGSSLGGGSSYGSGYGGYGSTYGGYGAGRYGGSSSYGSGYGSSYGGYGGGLSNYGNSYGRYGLGYQGPGPRDGNAFQSVLDGGQNQMNRFGIIVESFSRFSRLLDANFDALHGSFASVIRLIDVFGEFFYVVRTFAVFRLLFGSFGRGWRILNLLLGRDTGSSLLKSGSEGIELNDYKKFQATQNRKRSLPMMLVMMGIICASLPLLFVKLWRAASKMKLLEQLEPEKLEDVWSNGRSGGNFGRAKFSFSGETEMDLPFREGDTIRILSKPFPEWWEGELNGRKGLFPSNFVEEESEMPKQV